MYCIVDIETTGGSATKSRITEVAIFKTDGKKVIDSYTSLVNPARAIPPHISRLTGITDKMVSNAPFFHEIAHKVDQFTQDCVFVAHNVNFDYSFFRAEFQRLGRSYKRKKLCTVRLSRQIIKGKASYSLGKLCRDLEIPLLNRHRAYGDAEATTLLFHLLLEKDKEEVIQNSLKPQSLEALLPPNLPKTDFLALPEEQGLYFFKDSHSKIVYIGQAKNIKKRVHSHFSGNSNSRSKYYFSNSIHGIDFQLIPNPLLLDLQEAIEIKKHWPRYNRSLKRVTLNYGIFGYLDQKGYQRFAIGRCGKYEQPFRSFKSREDCVELLRTMLYDFELCPRLTGLQPLSSGKCNYIEDVNCKGACCEKEKTKTYNSRAQKAIDKYLNNDHTYLLEEEVNDSKAIILVEKGRLKGFANIDSRKKVKDLKEAKSLISSIYDDQDLRMILQKHIPKAKLKNAITYFN